MKILSISARNFRVHAETDIELSGEGVTGIIGPNESGKSSILEGIVWALYGASPTRGSKGSLRWMRAAARRTASVTLRFSIGGRTYRLERGESTAKLIDEASEETIAETTSGVDKYVPTLLRMGHSEFMASFMCGQKDISRLANMGPTERQTFIRSVLGVGQIDEGLKACRKRKNELSSEREGMAAGLGDRSSLAIGLAERDAEAAEADHVLSAAVASVTEASADVEAAGSTKDAVVKAKAARDLLMAELRNLATAEEGHQKEIESLKVRLRQSVAAQERLKAAELELSALPSMREKRDAMKEARASERGRLEWVQRIEESNEERAKLEERANAHDMPPKPDPEAFKAAQRALAAAEATLASARQKREAASATATAEARAASAEAARLDKQAAAFEAIGNESPCPTCTRPMGEVFDDVLATLRSGADRHRVTAQESKVRAYELSEPDDDEIVADVDVDAARDAVDKSRSGAVAYEMAEGRVKHTQELLAHTVAQVERFEERLAGIPPQEFDEGELKAVEEEVAHLTKVDSSLTQDRSLAYRTEETTQELVKRTRMVKDANADRDRVGGEVEALAFDHDEHDAAVSAHADAVAVLEDARIHHARADEAKRSAAAVVSQARAALERYDELATSLESVTTQLGLHERADQRISEFRVAVAGTIKPDLEELMSGFVNVLTDGRHEAVSLDDGFAPTFYESGLPMEVISGGAEDIAALAMRLAISQTIAERAGHPLSLLILDEPFGHQDKTRSANVLTLIRRLRGVFDQVLVISHMAETRDAADHVIELEFDEVAGMTRVVA